MLLLALDHEELCAKLPGELLEGLLNVELWDQLVDAINGLPAVGPEPLGLDLVLILGGGVELSVAPHWAVPEGVGVRRWWPLLGWGAHGALRVLQVFWLSDLPCGLFILLRVSFDLSFN